MEIYTKAVLIWLLIAAVETIHGIIRARLIAPKIGDLRSRQIGVLTGSVLIFIITVSTFKWINPESNSQALLIGGIWFTLMLLFELLLGHYVFRFPWKWLFQEFNILKGKLLLFGMIFLFLCPYLVLNFVK